MTYNQFW